MLNPIDMIQVIRKLLLIPVLTLLLIYATTAQNLFTCDGRSVSKEDFLKAYNKNNTAGKPTQQSYRDYLGLYIRYKLKVRAAYEQQLDTLAAQRTELQNFRTQVAENYMKDEESLNKLINEAFARGQKDLRVAHIFIAIPKNALPSDTLRAYEKAGEAYRALRRGRKFAEVAQAFSDDPSAKTNGGDIGYITVFTLPYELETLAYSTPAGQFSRPFRSKAGYHIFKVLGERRSLGRIRVAQILIALPAGSSEPVREAAGAKADSLYNQLQQGADFASLARSFSADNLSYQNGGEMPEFGIGKYDSSFEAAAFALDKDGTIGKPLVSPFGYHILKRLARKPFPHQLNKAAADELRASVTADPRIVGSRKALLRRIFQQAGFSPSLYSESDLWAFTDSVTLNRALSSFNNLFYNTVLFSFSRQSYRIKDWFDYFHSVKTSRPTGNARPDKEIFEQFKDGAALEYYRNHLEEFNKDFAFQLQEFKEGNLLFEIMQRKIWDKASTDSAGLRNYFEAHKDKYWWELSADALLFTCNSRKTAEALRNGLEGNITGWKKIVDSAGAGVQADSGRYELAQIPVPEKTNFSPGMFTALSPNKTDNTVSFSYILNVYNQRSPRSYKDARGFVINDYQSWLEDQWVEGLKKKYPVNVDEAVFATLPK
jgi:peptidyl-prolyl cis-trans isomerase SurA